MSENVQQTWLYLGLRPGGKAGLIAEWRAGEQLYHFEAKGKGSRRSWLAAPALVVGGAYQVEVTIGDKGVVTVHGVPAYRRDLASLPAEEVATYVARHKAAVGAHEAVQAEKSAAKMAQGRGLDAMTIGGLVVELRAMSAPQRAALLAVVVGRLLR